MHTSPLSELSRGLADLEGRPVPLERILVVVDPGAVAQPALEKAVQVAMHFNSSLELYVDDIQQDIPESWVGDARSREYRDLMRKRAQDELQRLAGPVRGRGLQVSATYEWQAPPQQGFGQHAFRTRPDLVVKERHRQAPAGTSVSRTDWILIQEVPAALLLVHSRPWNSPLRIAAAVDPGPSGYSALSERIVKTAQRLAEMPGGGLETFHVAEGDVTDGLVRLVNEHKPDVLLLGASSPHTRHAPTRGTAARVLTQANCDVLVIKLESR